MLNSLDSILTFLETNLNTAISEIESIHSVTITPYKELKKYLSLGRQFPSISLNPDTTDPMEESAGNRGYFGNPTHRDDIIAISVWDKGIKTATDTIETNVVGYMDALDRLFKGDYTISGVKGIEILGTAYTPLIPDLSVVGNENLLLKGATLQIRVKYNII